LGNNGLKYYAVKLILLKKNNDQIKHVGYIYVPAALTFKNSTGVLISS